MVNFSNVEIVRAIMHRVNQKLGDNAATVTPSDHLLVLDDEAKQIIKERLVTAFGRQSKSFELEIEDDGENSCFNTVRSLRGTTNEQFIALSVEIANLLADSQRQQRIPGGFLLVVHCLYENKPVYVLIKAEPHEALGVSEMNVRTIKDIILSPEQKLYKAVYYEQKVAAADEEVLEKDNYRVVLFDSIVSSNSSIAQYFYKDFLGILNNANITVNPHDIITTIIPLDNRDDFMPVIDQFPQSFAKDTSLINNRLGKKSILLSDTVRITAPASFFDQNVEVQEGENGYVVTIRR